jgi:hypothetical protein
LDSSAGFAFILSGAHFVILMSIQRFPSELSAYITQFGITI